MIYKKRFAIIIWILKNKIYIKNMVLFGDLTKIKVFFLNKTRIFFLNFEKWIVFIEYSNFTAIFYYWII